MGIQYICGLVAITRLLIIFFKSHKTGHISKARRDYLIKQANTFHVAADYSNIYNRAREKITSQKDYCH
jgi:hypothetical protein